MTRERSRSGTWQARWSVCLLALLPWAAAEAAPRGSGPGPKGAPLGGPIRDVATKVSVPVSADQSLVVTAPAGFWVQCPRWLPVPTTLAGEGLIVQHVSSTGGTHALIYMGTVPLGGSFDGDGPDARGERAASDFLTGLAAAYAKVDFRLVDGPVPLKPSTHKIGGKKQTVWRAGPYHTQPGDGVPGPDAAFTAECLMFQPAGTEVLAYLVVDVKLGATTFAEILSGLAVMPTRTVHASGGPVQINDLFEAADGTYPVRLLTYDRPPGFAFAQATEDAGGRLVYGEDRLDERGQVSATHRLWQENSDRARSLAEEAEAKRAAVGQEQASALREVALGTPRTAAYVFSHPGPIAGQDGRAQSAVFRHNDKLFTFTWTTRSDAALAKQDAAAFDKLLASVQLSLRTRR